MYSTLVEFQENPDYIELVWIWIHPQIDIFLKLLNQVKADKFPRIRRTSVYDVTHVQCMCNQGLG